MAYIVFLFLCFSYLDFGVRTGSLFCSHELGDVLTVLCMDPVAAFAMVHGETVISDRIMNFEFFYKDN